MGERVKGRLVDTEFDEIDAEVGAYREANLLVALLLRYPEIGSVRFLPSSASITLSFWLHADMYIEARALTTVYCTIRRTLGLLLLIRLLTVISTSARVSREQRRHDESHCALADPHELRG